MTKSFTASSVRFYGLAAMGGLMALTAAMIPPDGSPKAWLAHWLGMIVFGAFALLGVAQGVSPVTLRITPKGFGCTGGPAGSYFVPWGDVGAFSLKPVNSRLRLVVWAYRPGARPSSAILRLVVGLGRPPVLPAFLPLTPEALLELMDQALAESRK